MFAVIETEHEVGFNFTAATQTPGGPVDFLDEHSLKYAGWREFAEEHGTERRVALFFAGTNEVAREEAEDDGVFGGFGFSFFGGGSGGGLCVGDIGCDLRCG